MLLTIPLLKAHLLVFVHLDLLFWRLEKKQPPQMAVLKMVKIALFKSLEPQIRCEV